jgi:uncharacterized membrane protein
VNRAVSAAARALLAWQVQSAPPTIYDSAALGGGLFVYLAFGLLLFTPALLCPAGALAFGLVSAGTLRAGPFMPHAAALLASSEGPVAPAGSPG